MVLVNRGDLGVSLLGKSLRRWELVLGKVAPVAVPASVPGSCCWCRVELAADVREALAVVRSGVSQWCSWRDV